MRRQTSRAFTLVELLVVIGIISVLISILLPALSRARQAANLVDCQARLQQMGQALNLYVSGNKGLLPWGVINRPPTWTADKEMSWWWFFTLNDVLRKNTVGGDGYVNNLSPLFKDRDTIDAPADGTFTDVNGQQQAFFWVNHYTSNPRVLYDAHVRDSSPEIFNAGVAIAPADRTQRKISSVQHPSNVFVIWDGPQVQDQGYNTYGTASSLDGWAIDATTGLCFNSPHPVTYNRPSPPGQIGGGGHTNGRALQKTYNIDARTAFGAAGWQSHLRFRHMNNTELNALCLDGHVETRKVGEVLVSDYCTNYH